jgi:hypothetical protein
MHLVEPMATAGATDCSFFVGLKGAPCCSNCLSQIDADGSGHMETCPCSGQIPPAAVALSDEVEVFKYQNIVVGTCYTYAEYTREDRGKYFYWSDPDYMGAFDRELYNTNGSITYIFNDNGKEHAIVVTERTCFQVTQSPPTSE